MHRHLGQPHYAPCSVGALMDPGFLRDAVSDANGERRVEVALFWIVLLCKLAPLGAWAAVVQRHLATSSRAVTTALRTAG
jgi:hypothetical protein